MREADEGEADELQTITETSRAQGQEKEEDTAVEDDGAHGRALFLDGDGSPGKQTEGQMAPGERRQLGEHAGQGHAREDDERGRGPSKKLFWTRPLHAKAVVTTKTGIKKSQIAGQCCLVVIPSKGGFNCGGNLVK